MLSSVEPVREVVSSTAERLGLMSRQRMANTLHWRSVVNAVLMASDALMFVIAEALVLGLRREPAPAHATRFDLPVDIAVCLLVSAVIWVVCLQVVGIYHRHVMGDGYRVNLLVIQAGLTCWLVLCALCFLMEMDVSLTGLNLTVACGVLFTMIERMALRPVVRSRRRNGSFAYNTAVVGSPEGILETLRILGQRQQLNYNPTVVCPVRWNATTCRVESDPDVAALRDNLTGGVRGAS
ncbi:hypothetical protein [Bifidobacterium aerophilum]|uniref:Sugar transferase n=1 Tax=Bifidobacterium aerophilum TaxID=1798155 RepID=A0A6N9Z5Q6_9BIFI|nr:hypothetical protein [Bifidobacterium aerophilum]NEG89730.1 hypothetical protein [Bifidobacterium aerophilum]